MGRRSFTLIEILIVISLMGAVTFGSVLGIGKQLSKARDAKRKLQLKTVYKALEEYYDSTTCYPQYLPACGQKLQLGNAMLLDAMPCDPLTNLPYAYVTNNDICNVSFKLYANLENKEDSDIHYLGCTYGCGPSCAYNYGHSSTNTSLDTCPAPVTPTVTPNPTTVPTLTPTPSVTTTPTITPIPTRTPTPTLTPTITPTPTPHIGQFVCAPGVGNEGHCTLFLYPELSDCPKMWLNDPLCNNECNVKANHCKNSKGKKP